MKDFLIAVAVIATVRITCHVIAKKCYEAQLANTLRKHS
jgi:hypothetical protein